MTSGETGVNHVVVENSNGERFRLIEAKAKLTHLAVGILIGLATLSTLVYGAVKFGMDVHVQEQVEGMVKDEASLLNRGMHDEAVNEVEKLRRAISAELDKFESDLDEQHELGVRLEERQIALDRKVDQNQEELLREIRAQRSN